MSNWVGTSDSQSVSALSLSKIDGIEDEEEEETDAEQKRRAKAAVRSRSVNDYSLFLASPLPLPLFLRPPSAPPSRAVAVVVVGPRPASVRPSRLPPSRPICGAAARRRRRRRSTHSPHFLLLTIVQSCTDRRRTEGRKEAGADRRERPINSSDSSCFGRKYLCANLRSGSADDRGSGRRIGWKDERGAIGGH